MHKFVDEIQRICKELNLNCEGHTESAIPHDQVISAPGQAILGMLRKSDVVKPFASHGKEIGQDSAALDLLRQELTDNTREKNRERVSQDSFHMPSVSSAVGTVSPVDVKQILFDMLSSDQFVSEFCRRLNLVVKQ